MANETHQLIPSVFSESVYLLDGQPLRFGERYYIIPIHDADIPECILMTGRQVEKSTTVSIKTANTALLVPHSRQLYVAPTNEQVKTFSRSRLGKLFQYSQNDFIKKNYMAPGLSDQVFMRELTNGAEIYLRHCYEEGDNIRGLSTDSIKVDEGQDVLVDALPVIRETQSHSTRKEFWLTGTPKTFSNTMQQYWDTSTQNEWIVVCPHCKTHQILGIKNMRPDKYVCRKCDGALTQFDEIVPGQEYKRRYDIRQFGYWKSLVPGMRMQGFRISQMMVPWIPPQEIWHKFQSYPQAKFYNEVLGRSYETADKPFTMPLLESITDYELSMYGRAEKAFANVPLFMGVDWGTGDGSYTVVVVGGFNQHGKFQILHVKRYSMGQELDPDWQLKDICYTMDMFKIKLALVDWGFGYFQNIELQKRYGRRAIPCYYSHNQKDKVKWDSSDQRYVVKRTEVLTDYVKLVQDHNIVWPGKDCRQNNQFMYDHHLAVMVEYRGASSGRSEEMFYIHPVNMPDDAFHASNYCYLASQLSTFNSKNSIQFTGTQSR